MCLTGTDGCGIVLSPVNRGFFVVRILLCMRPSPWSFWNTGRQMAGPTVSLSKRVFSCSKPLGLAISRTRRFFTSGGLKRAELDKLTQH